MGDKPTKRSRSSKFMRSLFGRKKKSSVSFDIDANEERNAGLTGTELDILPPPDEFSDTRITHRPKPAFYDDNASPEEAVANLSVSKPVAQSAVSTDGAQLERRERETPSEVIIAIENDGISAHSKTHSQKPFDEDNQSQRRRSKSFLKRAPSFMTYAIAGEECASKGDFARAVPLFLRALKLGTDTPAAIAVTLSQLGACYHTQREHEQALAVHKQELLAWRKMNDVLGQAKAYINLGGVHKSIDDLEKAAECYRRALKLAQGCNDAETQARALDCVGAVYHLLGNACGLNLKSTEPIKPAEQTRFDRAVKYYRKSFPRANRHMDPSGMGRACGYLASAYERAKDYDSASKFYEKKLQIALETGDLHSQSRAYNSLGNVCRSKQLLDKAIHYYTKDLEVCWKLGDQQSEAVTHSNLGSAHQAFGQYMKAIEHHEKHLDIMERLGNRAGLAWAHDNLGFMYEHCRQYDKAAYHFQQHADLSHDINDPVSEVEARENFQRAMQYAQQGIHVVHMETEAENNIAARAPRALKKETVRGFSKFSRKFLPSSSVRGYSSTSKRSRLGNMSWGNADAPVTTLPLANMAHTDGMILRDNTSKQINRKTQSTSFSFQGEHLPASSDSELTASDDEDNEIQLRTHKSKFRQRISSIFSKKNIDFINEEKQNVSNTSSDHTMDSALRFDPSRVTAGSCNQDVSTFVSSYTPTSVSHIGSSMHNRDLHAEKRSNGDGNCNNTVNYMNDTTLSSDKQTSSFWGGDEYRQQTKVGVTSKKDPGYLEVQSNSSDGEEEFTMPDVTTPQGKLLAAILNFDGSSLPQPPMQFGGSDKNVNATFQQQHKIDTEQIVDHHTPPPQFLSSKDELEGQSFSSLLPEKESEDLQSTNQFVAVRTYHATQDGQLTFQEGDIFIDVTTTETPGVLLGTHQPTGQRGFVSVRNLTNLSSTQEDDDEATDL